MRKVLVGLALMAVLGVLWIGFVVVASESGEVVVLQTRGEGDDENQTRLWVIDEAGRAWLRAGSPRASWLVDLRERPEVEVTRMGETLSARATPVPQRRERINTLMREKYGWADIAISVFYGRDDAIPVRLDPL